MVIAPGGGEEKEERNRWVVAVREGGGGLGFGIGTRLKRCEGSMWEEEGEAQRRCGSVRTMHTLSTCFAGLDDKDKKEMVEGLSG
jgi:hypothetical protein